MLVILDDGGGGDVGLDEDDQDNDADQRTQSDQQQLQDDDQMEILIEDDLAGAQSDIRTDSSKRIRTLYMTKYQRARVLGTRALQIAMRKLKEKKEIPMIIRHYLPDESFEDWSIDELILTD